MFRASPLAGLLLAAVLAPACLAQSKPQGLPDISQFEVENLRLTILDTSGAKRGSLEGKLARKKGDGNVDVQGAVLTLKRKVESVVIRADSFLYTPDTGAFDCPSGLKAELPGGGGFAMPSGKGSITEGDEIVLKATGTGLCQVNAGTAESGLLGGDVVDPTVEIHLRKGNDEFEWKTFDVQSTRGGTLRLRVDRDVKSVESKSGGVVMLSCFGDLSATIAKGAEDKEVGRASLSMLRRARMSLDEDEIKREPGEAPPARPFEITANLIKVRGSFVAGKGIKLEAALRELEIDAIDTVHLQGPAFAGFGAELQYREPDGKCEVKLLGDPVLDLDQTTEELAAEGGHATLHMKAVGYALLAAPREWMLATIKRDKSIPKQKKRSPPWYEMKLARSAQVWREAQAERAKAVVVEWHVSGREVAMTSRQLPATPGASADPVEEQTYEVHSEGFTPMVRVAGMSTLRDDDTDPGQRAAVFGTRAEGTIIGDRLKARVFGPDVLAIVYFDYALASHLRRALKLEPPPKKAEGPPEPRAGRLTIRAASMLELDVSVKQARANAADGSNAAPQPVWLSAEGSVGLEHAALPRDDRELVTMNGQKVVLWLADLRLPKNVQGDVANPGPKPASNQPEARLRLTELICDAGIDAVTTLGYDILISRGFKIIAEQDQTTHVETVEGVVFGPGRLVARDKATLDYFRTSIERLQRRGVVHTSEAPDAGWMNFGGDVRLASNADRRVMDAAKAVLQLVVGEFEDPRAGIGALKDLAELVLPEVKQLYFVEGARLFVQSTGYASDPPAVVNLLRLEGNARLISHLDRLEAFAEEAIELSGAEDQSTPGNPLTMILLGKPRLTMEQADLVFGEGLAKGAFAYDGKWNLSAGQRLELTRRPLSVGSPKALESVRANLAFLGNEQASGMMLLAYAERARKVLQGLVDTLPQESTPESDQPRKALRHATAATRELRHVMQFEAAGGRDAKHRARVARFGAHARSLLSGLADVAAFGGVTGEFTARDSAAPPLRLEMTSAVVSLNGLGEVVDTRAEGPVKVSSSDYTLAGNKLTQARDGTLTLDGATIHLPASTGVLISGVTAISLRQVDGDSGEGAPPTMVTRIGGNGLKVKMSLAQPDNK